MRQITRKGLMTVAAATGVIAAASGYAHADAGAAGTASGSSGVLSGNTVQAPLHVPVNVCGNTVGVAGLLSPAVGNTCVNQGGGSRSSGGHGDSGHQGSGHGGSHADGGTGGSSGVGSGNHVQVPVDVPANVCGNSVDVIGVGNPATGNRCGNGGGGHHGTPPGGGHETPPEHPGTPGDPGTPEHPGTPGGPDAPGNPGIPGRPDAPGNPGTPVTPPVPGGATPGGSTHVNQPGTHSVAAPGSRAQLARTGSDLPMSAVLPVGAGALLAGAVLYRRARAAAR